MPDLTISGVPATVSRKAFFALVELMGFDIHGLVSFEATIDGLDCEVWAKDGEGHRIPGKHRVHVPFDSAAE